MQDAEKYMSHCIQLAKRGLVHVNPNPLVGCVIVKNGKIISEGWHRAVGQNHAERMAILGIDDKTQFKDADLYVNLEPCSHFGRTPPCANLIVEHSFKRVFVGYGDPNPLVSGSGIQLLENHGIEVVQNILVEDCLQLNRFFYTFHHLKRPFVTLKWAETLDGFMAPEPLSRLQISGSDSQFYTHNLRAQHSAILVGVSTWEIDKPKLNNRLDFGTDPLKMVLDPKLRGSYEDVQSRMVVFNFSLNQQTEMVEYVMIDPKNMVDSILNFMFKHQLNSLLVEGGAQTLDLFLNACKVDEIHQYVSQNIVFSKGLKAPEHQLNLSQTIQLQSDIYKIYRK